MSIEFELESKEEFLEKLEELVKKGVKPADIETLTPFHVHEAEHILKRKTSQLRFFTLTGALAGFFTSFIFMIYTVVKWPLITGGKPLLSIPAFIIVSFECTILLGGIVSFLGFLHLNRLPNIGRIVEPRECGSRFIIYVLATEDTEVVGDHSLRRSFGPSFGALIGAPGITVKDSSLPKKQMPEGSKAGTGEKGSDAAAKKAEVDK